MEMREHGHPVGVIAQRFGLTYAQVYDVLAEAGMADDWMAVLYRAPAPALPPTTTEERAARQAARKARIAMAYRDGKPLLAILREFHCAQKLVYDALAEAGVPRRRRANSSNGLTEDQRRQFRKLRYTGDMSVAEARAAVGAPLTL